MAENDDRPAWFAAAACATAPIDWFFPDRGQDSSRAKDICAACPVRELCLEHFLHERHGIWGGLSERQRRQLRAQRRLNAPAAAAPDAGDGGHDLGSGSCPRPEVAHLRRVK